MCLILFAKNAHPKYKFILAANRDEFYNRPTASAAFWNDAPNLLAGKDLVHGGAWLGITKTGRFATVTNYRDPNQPTGKRSRGALVIDFLLGAISVSEYSQEVEKVSDEYTGFNLLVGDFGNDGNELAYFSNRGDEIKMLNTGFYGLSNHLLDAPWQKVLRGKKSFSEIISNESEISLTSLFNILQNKTFAKDEDLPNTGIGNERERILSPMFIETPIYGTRCSTVLLIGNDNSVTFAEKSYHPIQPETIELFDINSKNDPLKYSEF